MRRWMAAPLVFAVAATLAVSTNTQPVQAQGKAPPAVEETCNTADGVQIHLMFHKSANTPGTDPVVIMMYPPGKDNNMNKGDWEGLANKLAAAGYNVIRFDWRAHGKSTEIKDTAKFWNLPVANDPIGNPWTGPWNNKYIKGAPTGAAKAPKATLTFADINNPQKYAPVLLNDLAAVRHHLDIKNDGGSANTRSVYLIGAGDAAAIGFAWMTAEWHRPESAPTPNQLAAPRGFPTYKVVPQPLVGGLGTEAGNDISAAIWLSASRPTDAVLPAKAIKDWVALGAPKLRDNNPMLFLYSAGDKTTGKAQSEFYFNDVLVANPKVAGPVAKLTGTFLKELKGGDIKGVGLLGNDATLGTETEILKFMTARQKDRAALIPKPRNFANPYFIDLAAFKIMP